MGVDAQMLVKTKKPLSWEEVRRISVQLADCYGTDAFMISEDYGHALEIVDEYYQDGDTVVPSDGEQFIEVRLWGRYYGVGYERGPLMEYISIAQWLEIVIPDCVVLYGGDSSGICAEPFDAAAREKLFRHFIEVGHSAYHGFFGEGPGCDFCLGKAMSNHGGSSRYDFYSCHGCGKHVIAVKGGEFHVLDRYEDFHNGSQRLQAEGKL